MWNQYTKKYQKLEDVFFNNQYLQLKNVFLKIKNHYKKYF
jgi:hypothetical protein